MSADACIELASPALEVQDILHFQLEGRSSKINASTL